MKTKDLESTLASRTSQHGDFTDNAQVSQCIQKIFHISKNWDSLLPIQREALQIIAHKIGRILSGDYNFADHWHDIAGYAKCVEDRLPKIDKEPMVEIKPNESFPGVTMLYNIGSESRPNWIKLGELKDQRCPSCGGSKRTPIPGYVRCGDPQCDCYLQDCPICNGTGGVLKNGTI